MNEFEQLKRTVSERLSRCQGDIESCEDYKALSKVFEDVSQLLARASVSSMFLHAQKEGKPLSRVMDL